MAISKSHLVMAVLVGGVIGIAGVLLAQIFGVSAYGAPAVVGAVSGVVAAAVMKKRN